LEYSMNWFLRRLLFLTSVFSTFHIYSQQPQKPVPKMDTINPAKGDPEEQLKKIKDTKIILHSDSIASEPKKVAVDTTVQNKYGDLLNDDPEYNRKYHWSIPVLETIGANGLTWSIDHYVLNADFSYINTATWKDNINKGWEWDADRFGINFIGHPYSGTLYYNTARSNGYNYWQSFPFAVGGSLMWEYFGENTRPSYNDIINTPVNGTFIGEIFYRISSNILDDRTRGLDRVLRELAAGLIDPARGFNRIVQGKMFRSTNREVYQKEPLNITLFAGINNLNQTSKELFGKGSRREILNLQLDYGNPFENRTRKPFDLFKIRIDLRYGEGRKILDNLTGYGILTGKNFESDSGHHAMLLGAFQYYDYWDNQTFELGAIGFGGGVLTKLLLDKASKSNLYTAFHVAAIPFAGNSTMFGPDTSQFRDYDFGGGLEGKFEMTLAIGEAGTVKFIGYYYWFRTYVGIPGDNFIGIIEPRLTVRITGNLSVGYEHYVYYDDRYPRDFESIHLVRSEDKIFLMLYLEDKQRRGHYN
jgi:hypothetical protein